MTFLTSRKVNRVLWIGVILLLNACGSASRTFVSIPPEAPVSIIKSPMDKREYASMVLDNQLEVVLVSDPSVKKSAAALSVAVGSLQEPREFGGLAHYLEHMLLLGTKSFPKANGFSDFVSANGGTHNAYTALNYTNYAVTVNNAAFDEALARFSGFFYEALLDETYADKERNAVHSEWTMNATNDWVVLEQLNGSTLNPEHPISQFNWGNLETLVDKGERKLHTALVDMYDLYYSANLMKATLISHIPIEDMQALAKRYFGQIKNKHTPKSSIYASAANSQHVNKIIRYVPQSDMKQIRINFVMDNNAHRFSVKPNEYVSYLLSNEMPKTLAAELRNAGLSETVYSTYNANQYANAGSFTLYIDLTEAGLRNRDKVMGAAFKYITLLREQGVDPKYYEEIRKSLSNSFRFQEQVNDYDYASQISAALQHIPAKYVLSYGYDYQRFDPQAIQAVLDQLTLANARVFYIDQAQTTDQKMVHFSGQYSVQEITTEIAQQWQHLSEQFSFALPRVNNLMPENFELVTQKFIEKPVHLVNEPGLSIHLGHSALFNQPKGVISFDFNTGITNRSAKNLVLANLLNLALNEHLVALQTEASAGGMGLNVNLFNGLSITASGFTDKHQGLLLDTVDQITNFRITTERLDNLKHSFRSLLHSSKKQAPYDQLFPKFNQVVSLDWFSHSAMLTAIDKVLLSDINDFPGRLLQQANLRILAFGNYAEDDIKNLSNQVLQRLPKERNMTNIYQTPFLPVAKKTIYSWEEDLAMSDNGLLDMTLMPRNIQDLAAARILTKLVQPVLFNQIRTEEQLAYAVEFFGHTFKDQMMVGYAIQSPNKGLADLASRIQNFRDGFIQHLMATTPTVFTETKQGVLLSLTQTAKNIAQEMGGYADDWQEERLQFNSKKHLVEALRKITIEDVVNLYKRIEKGGEFTRVLIQMRGTSFVGDAFFEPEGAIKITDIDGFHRQFNP